MGAVTWLETASEWLQHAQSYTLVLSIIGLIVSACVFLLTVAFNPIGTSKIARSYLMASLFLVFGRFLVSAASSNGPIPFDGALLIIIGNMDLSVIVYCVALIRAIEDNRRVLRESARRRIRGPEL